MMNPEITEEDEDVITRRILINDPILQLLQKLIVNWVMTDYDNVNDSVKMYNNILAVLSDVVHNKNKCELIKRRTFQEVHYYRDFKNALEDRLNDIKDTLKTGKMLLFQVKEEYRKKFIYHLIAKELEDIPNKIQARSCLETLKSDFERLQKELDEIDKQQARWQDNFKIFYQETEELNDKIKQLKEATGTLLKRKAK